MGFLGTTRKRKGTSLLRSRLAGTSTLHPQLLRKRYCTCSCNRYHTRYFNRLARLSSPFETRRSPVRLFAVCRA
jgi:hypothetical protein